MPFGVQLGMKKTRFTLATKPPAGFKDMVLDGSEEAAEGIRADRNGTAKCYDDLGSCSCGNEVNTAETRPALGQTAARLGFPALGINIAIGQK